MGGGNPYDMPKYGEVCLDEYETLEDVMARLSYFIGECPQKRLHVE
jgi:hypothetical protein